MPNILVIKPGYKSENACILKKYIIFFLPLTVAPYCCESVLIPVHYTTREITILGSNFRVGFGLPEMSF